MSLANLFLFSLGLAAMAVPLWVHLRLGRVKKRAVVSTLRLMRATTQTSKTPRRIVDLPLFLLRCLILLLLALGFGRLLVPALGGNRAQEYAVFILDVSGSMRAQNGRVWEQARRETLNALGELSRASRVALVLSPSAPGHAEWETPAVAIERVKTLSPGYGSNRISAALREAGRLLGEMPGDYPKVIHLVSDCQRSAFADIDRATIASGVELRISKVGDEHLSNRGVTASVIAAGMTDIGLYAFNDGAGGTLTLNEDGRSQPLTLTSSQGSLKLIHNGKAGAWVTRKLTLEDADDLPDDNVAYDAYQAQDEIPVWLWEPPGDSEELPSTPLIGKTTHASRPDYQQASYYVSRGLQPGSGDETAPISRYRPVLLTEDGLDAARARIGAKDAPRLLILPASDNLPALAKTLVSSGGSVIFFGGPGLDGGDYATQFSGLTGVKIQGVEKYEHVPALGTIAEDNPLWGILSAEARHELVNAPLRVRYRLQLEAGTRVLAAYADGSPFVVEKIAGHGRVYFVNTSADRAWGDWAASAPLFVPALHLLAARALGDESFLPAHAPVLAGEAVTVQLPAQFAGRSLKLGDATWPIGEDGRAANVVFEKPGVIDLALTDGTRVGKMAVNFPPTESALESDSAAVVRQRLESLRQKQGGSSVRREGEARGGLAWRLCLLLSALLLVVEPVFASRHVRA